MFFCQGNIGMAGKKAVTIKKGIFPLTVGLRGTTILKAFFLNAMVLSIVSALSIEVRQLLDEWGRKAKGGWALSDTVKTAIVAVSAFSVAISVYLVMWMLVGYGGGLIASQELSRFM
jgi:hypothetical protein